MNNGTSREIVGEVRFALSNELRDQYPDRDGTRGFFHSAEAYLVRVMCDVDVQGRAADYYIAPGDGGGLIVVEVGDRDAEQWQSMASKDGQPVRVLNVGLDHQLKLAHPRNTPFEADLMRVLGKNLGA